MNFRQVMALSALLAATTVPAQDPAAAPEPAAAAAPTAAVATAPEAPAAAPTIPGDPSAGEAKAVACAACHGADGNPTDKQYPKLAGQNEAYIARQLEQFKNGKRMNPIMVGFVATLTPQDMHDIGAFFATKQVLPGVADEALVARGQALYRGGDAALGVPACMACHGPDGRGMAGAGYPQLAGQWADYVSAKLKEWKAGTTWGDDAHAAIMPAIVSRLSEADLVALASYVEGLHTADAVATGAP
jgi:cbb3-type cytochrome c oxidase subunit III